MIVNEADARDYPINEEVRALKVRHAYPAHIRPILADNLQMGRLTVTRSALGGELSQL